MQFRGIIADFQLANPLYVGGTVAFFLVDDNGRRTNTLADLYANPTGEQRLQNPLVLDGDGKFFRPVYFDAAVIAEVTSANVGTHDTGIISPHGTYKGVYALGVDLVTGDFVQSQNRSLYLAADTYRTVAGLDADLAAGRLVFALGPDTYKAELDKIEAAIEDFEAFEPIAAQFPDIRAARDQTLSARDATVEAAADASRTLDAIEDLGVPVFGAANRGKILTVGAGGTSIVAVSIDDVTQFSVSSYFARG